MLSYSSELIFVGVFLFTPSFTSSLHLKSSTCLIHFIGRWRPRCTYRVIDMNRNKHDLIEQLRVRLITWRLLGLRIILKSRTSLHFVHFFSFWKLNKFLDSQGLMIFVHNSTLKLTWNRWLLFHFHIRVICMCM